MTNVDIASLILRLSVGLTIVAHGWNHAFGGGRIAGTARWFESIGLRPGRQHALMATGTELGAGALLVLGLLTPLAAAGVVGTMVVALITNHLRNGFFIFRPGEGYEYVLMIICVSCGLGALGGGSVSLDGLLGLTGALDGWSGLAIAAGAGALGGALLLAVFWRPARTARQTTS
jgi:putative oxidoreductase